MNLALRTEYGVIDYWVNTIDLGQVFAIFISELGG
jgi:hypothetical protein